MRELEIVAKPDEKNSKQKMKLRIPRGSGMTRLILGPTGRIFIILFSLFVIAGLGAFTYFYARYARIIDEKLRAGVFANSAKIFAAPESVSVGDAMTPNDIATDLRRSGYTESRGNPVGYYQIHSNSIEVFPQSDSYFDQEPGLIRFANGKISQIISLQDNTARNQYQLEPQLIQAISGPAREKRRMVKFHDIPKILVDAVTSIEDKRFFQHSGFDPIRIMKAVYVDVKEGRKDQGASTLSMQTARMFFLTQDKSWQAQGGRIHHHPATGTEAVQRGHFRILRQPGGSGLARHLPHRGPGARLPKPTWARTLNSINLPEAAEIAGMIQRPGYFDPFRHPDRLRDRRNIVLQLMRQNNVITDRDYALAIDAPLTVTKTGSTSVEAPYFVDMVNDKLQNMFQDADFQSNAFRVYTTIDMRLQRAAVEAVRLGMASVDEQIKKQRRFKGQTPPTPQVAMVAIDPHTGEVKALVGGRNYGLSQLNHSLAKRQPGSIFKPFVYATALDTAVSGGPKVFTASTTVVDEPTTFYFDNQSYTPSNFEKKFYGTVTLRDALAHSLNVATVKVGQMVGFDAVVDMANRAGMNYKIQPTPAVALGAYEITPVEAAGAYTIFANGGDYLKPSFVSMVRAQDGKVVFKNKVEEKQVLDPRVAYLTTSLMEEVLRSGTAAGVRARYNLTVPMAGKTGTSHDGWFAGYTSELACAWSGWASTTTANSIWKARTRRRPYGPSS